MHIPRLLFIQNLPLQGHLLCFTFDSEAAEFKSPPLSKVLIVSNEELHRADW